MTAFYPGQKPTTFRVPYQEHYHFHFFVETPDNETSMRRVHECLHTNGHCRHPNYLYGQGFMPSYSGTNYTRLILQGFPFLQISDWNDAEKALLREAYHFCVNQRDMPRLPETEMPDWLFDDEEDTVSVVGGNDGSSDEEGEEGEDEEGEDEEGEEGEESEDEEVVEASVEEHEDEAEDEDIFLVAGGNDASSEDEEERL